MATFDSSFPRVSLPVSLGKINFQTSDELLDPITGESLRTTVSFSASDTASGYQFQQSSTDLVTQPFDLDVDGDGKVSAFGDGLMIIRKIFGSAFDGDALIDKVISPDSPYLGQDDAALMVAQNIDALNNFI